MIQIFDPVRYCLHIHTRWCCRTTAEPLAQEKSSSMWLYFLHRQEIKSRMRTCLLCVVSIHSKVWKVFYIENCPVAMPILMWIIVVTIIVWRMNNGFILMTGQWAKYFSFYFLFRYVGNIGLAACLRLMLDCGSRPKCVELFLEAVCCIQMTVLSTAQDRWQHSILMRCDEVEAQKSLWCQYLLRFNSFTICDHSMQWCLQIQILFHDHHTALRSEIHTRKKILPTMVCI